MEAIAFIVVIISVVVPLLVLWKVFAISDTVRNLEKRCDSILRRLDSLQHPAPDCVNDCKVETIKENIRKPGDEIVRKPASPETFRPVMPPPPPPAPPVLSASAVPPPPPVAASSMPAANTGTPSRAGRRNLEKLVGENIFSKIGILALVIGIGFFVKFAIDNDWVNEVGRTAIGLVTGFGLWGIAYFLRDKYRSFSSVLAGGGFAVCFVTVAVAYNFYRLCSSGVAFGTFVVLTAFMIFISLRFDRRELSTIGFLGGFVAPFLSVGETSSCLMLFGYVTVLNVGMAFVTVIRRWWELSAVGCLLTWIIVIIYLLSEPAAAADSALMLTFSTLFVVLFSMPLATVLSHERGHSFLFLFLIVASMLNFVTYLLVGLYYVEYVPVLRHIRGVIPFIVAALCALLFMRFYRGSSDRLMQNLLLGSVIVFASLVSPIQFSDPSVIIVCLAALMLGFVIVYVTGGRTLFALAASLLGAFDAILLYVSHPVSIYAGSGFGAVWTYALTGLAFIAAAAVVNRFKMQKDKSVTVETVTAYRVLLWVGTAMWCVAAYLLVGRAVGPMEAMTAAMAIVMAALLLVSLYACDSGGAGWLFPGAGTFLFVIWCGAPRDITLVNELLQWSGALLLLAVMVVQGNRIFSRHAGFGPFSCKSFAVYFTLSASVFIVSALLLMLRSVGLTRYYSAGFSVGLIVCGALAMAAGMYYRTRVVRMVSLALFGVLLSKLVVYDLWQLPMLGRIAVFILLGAVLLVISFSYQKLRKSLFDDSE